MKSIYISICCLKHDSELINTLKSAIDNSSKKYNIVIGLACIGDKDFYNKVMSETSSYSNIQYKYYELENNLGVGKGRSLAASMYSNEDYFLQVDSHTFFLQNWDSFLVKKFEKAKKITKNNKVVLSGLPGRYGYYNDKGEEEFWYYDKSHYQYYQKDNYKISESFFGKTANINNKTYKNFIVSYSDYDIFSILIRVQKNIFKKIFNYFKYIKLRFGGMLPAIKVSAAYIFSDYNLGKNTLVLEDSMFWEEEITQTINLISNNFSIVYPSIYTPLCHMYTDFVIGSAGKRSSSLEFISIEESFSIQYKNWIKYYENNKDAIKKYEEYSQVDLLDGPKSMYYIPKKYNN